MARLTGVDVTVFDIGGSSVLADLRAAEVVSTTQFADVTPVVLAGVAREAVKQTTTIRSAMTSTKPGGARVTHFDVSALALAGLDYRAVIEQGVFEGRMRQEDGSGLGDEWEFPVTVQKDYRARLELMVDSAGSVVLVGKALGNLSGKDVGFTVTHDEEVVLDDGSTTEGWSGSGVTISAGISIDVGSGGGSASRVFSPGIVAEAHRYLEIEVRSLLGDGVPFSIGIQDKSWEFDTDDAGVWTTVRIDLCRPDSVTVEWDDKESRYPLDEFGEVEDSVHWGVSLIESLGFGGLVGGETYEIREIRLKRIGAAKLSFLPAFRRWGLRQAEVLDQVEPLVWSEVDGRVADCFGMSVLGGVYSWQNLTNLINSLDSLGWDVNPGLAIGDGYHNNLLEAELAWGGGVLSGSGGIHSGCDRVGSSGLEVKAQALWDEVEVYPTAGDVWSEDGDFGALTELYSAKVLRAHAWGLVLDDDGVRSGESVQLKAGSELRGSDTSDSRGFYLTRLPGGLEEPGHRVVVGATESVEFAPFTRMRHRRVLREQATAGAVSFDWHLSGMAVRASIGSGDMVRLALKGNAVSAGYFVRTVPFSAASLSVRWDLGRRLRLVLVTEEEGQIRERFSDDLGVTWSMATTLAVGNVRFPGLFIHPDGRRFVYWIEDGNVNGVIRDRSGGILQSVTGARSSVMDKGLAVGGLDQMGGRVSIELVTVESDTIISSLSTDGATFS